jgi:hypothetical protein
MRSADTIFIEAWWIDRRNRPHYTRRSRRKPDLLHTAVMAAAAAIVAFLIFMLLLHNRHTWWPYNLQSERSAQRAVERYLETVRSEEALNLLHYTYVTTLHRERIDAIYRFIPGERLAEGLVRILTTFETYDSSFSDLEHLLDGASSGKSVTSLYDHQYVFLYDLVLANEFGGKYFKQFIFEVQPTFFAQPSFTIRAAYQAPSL